MASWWDWYWGHLPQTRYLATVSAASLRGLVKDTAIYGLSSILGRVIGFLLVPLYTAVFAPEAFHVQTILYIYISFFMVFYVLRLDTAYFRYRADEGSRVFDTVFSTILTLAAVASLTINGAAHWLTTAVINIDASYVPHVRLMALILVMDAAAEIPFAKLRYQQRALRFASIRITGILLNIGLNLTFLLGLPYLITAGHLTSPTWYAETDKVQFIFISNALSSLAVITLLYPEWSRAQLLISRDLIRRLLSYSLPLVVVSFAGLMNEMIDRILLDRLLPFDDESNKSITGVYSAVYKFSIIIALFTQSYRYAAEPFFFAHARDSASPRLYARMADYFTRFASFGMFAILLLMPHIAPYLLRDEAYLIGLDVVPLLIAAQIMLGIYYNLSVWYKLSDKTAYAMYIAFAGVAVTLAINLLFIPSHGYWASAWATLACYLCMSLLSYLIGRQHYPLEHPMVKLLSYVGVSAAAYYGLQWLFEQMALGMGIVFFMKCTILLLTATVLLYRMQVERRKYTT